MQAMCEMLSIVGKKLEENTKDKRRLEGYFVILEKWSKSKVSHLEPRPEWMKVYTHLSGNLWSHCFVVASARASSRQQKRCGKCGSSDIVLANRWILSLAWQTHCQQCEDRPNNHWSVHCE